ncbi:ABC-type transporter, integral membrane subunit [Caldalkalibacillus thermarum TA2.A1]|uniref:ABC-type transporter, integral membrane subunit n=1 Tax=Caldalkalibacillus thermarum (strain TA2.A1) TaxID=986075 RepID=F5LAX6_CALTT|nr:carbohydrate ABC transporter permease [Caldalkalibacillus thermarum]EGL81515.1 ABC-type transporter, integral membrane subunit [Caldalkalibacillus thermarum TA2.A1]QZT33814.1 carbohydrate ABC transporter permease [Caldalkalibacillus thermarum TA2.A1]
MRMKDSDILGHFFRLSRWPLLILFSLMMLVPVYLMFKISVSEPQDVLTQNPSFIIRNFTFDHWLRVFEAGHLWAPLLKSLTVATVTTIIAIIIAAPAAYVISLLPKKYQYTIILSLLFTRMFPDVGIALPISVTFISWNLLDTYTGLIMAHLIPNLPFLAWILVGTFQTIPRDLEKAAMIDGASRLTALRKVVFPIAAPGIAVGAMFIWLNSWNEFTYALYLTMAENTLPLQTYYYVVRGDWFQSAAYSMILTIPVIIVTFLLQRYMRSGFLAGAVKG